MAEDVNSVLSLVCDVILLAVSDAVTSSGYRQAIGQFVLPVVVEISGDQINPSASLLTPSIIASFHFILGVSSWTSTTVPLNYNFFFPLVSTCGATHYFEWKFL